MDEPNEAQVDAIYFVNGIRSMDEMRTLAKVAEDLTKRRSEDASVVIKRMQGGDSR